MTSCRSEAEDKKLWHQRWRACERDALAGLSSASSEALEAHQPLVEKQVSSAWLMGKDGRQYWPIGRQAIAARRMANRKGRSPQERSALTERLARKWMGK